MIFDHRVENHVVVADAAETVTAKHDDIAVVQLIDTCLWICTVFDVAQTAGDDIRQRMVVHQFRIQFSFVDKFLDVRVIFR